jgi:hypothetical protein
VADAGFDRGRCNDNLGAGSVGHSHSGANVRAGTGYPGEGMKKSNMGPVRVASEEAFETLLNRIDKEANRAADHWLLFKGLEASIKDYAAELNESPTFWTLTLNAHYDVVVFRLARIYDQDDSSFGLRRFLLTVKDQPDFFATDAFRKRLQHLHGGSHYLETQTTDARKLDPGALEEDILSVSAEHDPLVARLHKVRNAQISHLDPRFVAVSRLQLDRHEIEPLLKRARNLVDKYHLAYRACFSGKAVGSDDYKHLLDLVRKARKATVAKQTREIRKLRKAIAQSPKPGRKKAPSTGPNA